MDLVKLHTKYIVLQYTITNEVLRAFLQRYISRKPVQSNPVIWLEKHKVYCCIMLRYTQVVLDNDSTNDASLLHVQFSWDFVPPSM